MNKIMNKIKNKTKKEITMPKQQFGAKRAPRGSQRVGRGPGGNPTAGGGGGNEGTPDPGRGKVNRGLQEGGARFSPRGPQQFQEQPHGNPAIGRTDDGGDMGSSGTKQTFGATRAPRSSKRVGDPGGGGNDTRKYFNNTYKRGL